MLDRQVVCRHCNEPFRARPELATSSRKTCPGEHVAILPLHDPAAGLHIEGEPDRGLEAALAQLDRMNAAQQQHGERIVPVEQALLELKVQQQSTLSSLTQWRTESQAAAERDKLEIERLSVALQRVEDRCMTLLRELDRIPGELDRIRGLPIQNGAGLPVPSAPHPGRNGGPGRFSYSRPRQTPTPAGISGLKTAAGERSILRDALDRVSHCEVRAGQLVSELKTASEGRELERQAFERVLDRLQDTLRCAKSEFDIARGSARMAFDSPE